MKKNKREEKPIPITYSLFFRAVILSISLILLLIILIYRDELKSLSRYGYFGIFVVNFISSATIFLPVPGIATVFIGGAVWNPILVGLISGAASSIGELFGYFLGFGGRGFLKTIEHEGKWVKRLENTFLKSGFNTTLIFSLIPLPIFDAIGIIAGAVSYPVEKFFLATILGRTVRNIVLAWTASQLLPLN